MANMIYISMQFISQTDFFWHSFDVFQQLGVFDQESHYETEENHEDQC